MAGKRTYKVLTKKQTASVKRYTKQGKSQGAIAKLLGVSKQRVATSQRKAKIGVRVKSPFWKEVKQIREITGRSHREATEFVKYSPKWGKKRKPKATGYLTPGERAQAMRDKRAEFGETVSDKEKAKIDEYGEEIGLGDTPK